MRTGICDEGEIGEELLQTVLDAAFESIVLHENGRILYANASASQLARRPKEQLVGQPMSVFGRPKDQALFSDSSSDFYSEEGRRLGPLVVEGYDPTGAPGTIEMATKTIRYRGRLVQLTSWRDITQHRQVAKTLERRLEWEDLLRSLSARFINMPLGEISAAIFDPGFTTKGVGIGTGLGLSIVHQIVTDHGGRIEVESQEGEGATFRVTVPVRLPVRSTRPPAARSSAPA